MSALSEPSSSGQPEPSGLRASNADRERVASALHEAAAEGRIDLDELDARLNAAYNARTYAELEPLTRDLPLAFTGSRMQPTPEAPTTPALPASHWGVALLGAFKRAGRWTVGQSFFGFAFWGGGVIDLREAVFTGRNVKIRAVAIMGGVEIILPEHAAAHVNGLGIMGGFEDSASGPGAPGAPMVTVTGFSFWGGVDVKRKPTKAEARRRRVEKKQHQGEDDD